ncbi:DUF5954 family protein [Streptomyces silvisoli]|uniref:DUF5954 family protein n=1 Tax=Streptomyces silvisoli TaxID=3034235 RepID=A0ABT5ZJC3_9ACTN|nr:DUF5954 family protein [Streptomyces silvisoli]MDF3289781.1 DUF5954 family protein [Streptomyces silvisoli]
MPQRRCAERYPGGVLLPAVFSVSERVDGSWRAHAPGASYSTPQGARDGLAGWLRLMGPFTLDLELDGRALELKRLWEQEEARRAAVRERRQGNKGR